MNQIIVDVEGKSLGRAASEIAKILIGKDKTNFAYNRICGEAVLVKNVDKIVFTGRKETQKSYYRHSGYLGNLKEFKLADSYAKDPKEFFSKTVKGMLPKNKLQDKMIKKLKFEE